MFRAFTVPLIVALAISALIFAMGRIPIPAESATKIHDVEQPQPKITANAPPVKSVNRPRGNDIVPRPPCNDDSAAMLRDEWGKNAAIPILGDARHIGSVESGTCIYFVGRDYIDGKSLVGVLIMDGPLKGEKVLVSRSHIQTH